MHLRLFKQAAVGNRLRSVNFKPGDTNTGDRDWGNCQGCRLADTRRRVVVKRYGGHGDIRILFIGDNPDIGDEKMGRPIMGTAGRILHEILKLTHRQFHYCITNAVNCRTVDLVLLDNDDENPDIVEMQYEVDYDLQNWDRSPTVAETKACKDHITMLIEEYKPDGVIQLGTVPNIHNIKLPTIYLKHPRDMIPQEYKLLTAVRMAKEIDEFTTKLHKIKINERET